MFDILKARGGCAADPAAYARMRMWRDWWRGYYKPFHTFKELGAGGQVLTRRLFSLNMAKKICEDWAGILLNEQTTLAVEHPASSAFLQGTDRRGGVLESCGFWQRANALVEEAFCCGTGAFVLRLENMRLSKGDALRPDKDARIGLQYLPGLNIFPLTVQGGEMTEAAFCSESFSGGVKMLYVETHTLGVNGYVVENDCFTEKPGTALQPCPLPAGVAKRIETGSFIPLFCMLRPNTISTYDDAPGMGESVFSQAIDNLKGVDLAFNNLCRDFQLGGKKVFYSRSLLCAGENGALLAPDDICQQLFVAVDERMPNEAPMIVEHNPSLRVEDNVRGLQAQLDYLSLKCGLGPKHYRLDGEKIMTATQYVGDRQELVRTAKKHCLQLHKALCGVARMILWAGKEALGAPLDPKTNISASFDDTVFTDQETQRAQDRADVAAGLMRPAEYRVRWYGETIQAARAALNDKGGL